MTITPYYDPMIAKMIVKGSSREEAICIGETLSSWTLDNGLKAEKVSVPLGVIGMIYEARPNVTVDATGLVKVSIFAVLSYGSSLVLHDRLRNTCLTSDNISVYQIGLY